MNLGGTPDLWLDLRPIGENKIILADWKNGRMEVEHPENNYQLLSYAVMLMENNPDVESVEIVVMYTRIRKIANTILTREKAMFLRDIFDGIIKEAESKQNEEYPQFVTGTWCGSCFKCLECPAFGRRFIALSQFTSPDVDRVESQPVALETVLKKLLPIAKRAETISAQLIDLAKAYVDRHGTLDLRRKAAAAAATASSKNIS
jgi:hypothetical protein